MVKFVKRSVPLRSSGSCPVRSTNRLPLNVVSGYSFVHPSVFGLNWFICAVAFIVCCLPICPDALIAALKHVSFVWIFVVQVCLSYWASMWMGPYVCRLYCRLFMSPTACSLDLYGLFCRVPFMDMSRDVYGFSV